MNVGEPGKGEIRVKHHAVGLNFIDVYFRTGLYPMPLPGGLGMEAAGEVTAVGEGVTQFKPGDRVAYASRPPGAYAQERVISADYVVKLPDSVGYEDAASIMLQGLTAQYLLRRTYRVKAELAKAHGCDYPIVYTRDNFTQRVREITNGAGVPVVYDSIGKDTYVASLDCLAPLGLFVSFGNSSGPLPPIDSSEFAGRGSLFFTRPTLFSYIAKRSDLDTMAAELFDVVSSGKVKTNVRQRYALSDAAKAHEDLEARKTTGSTIFLP
ncbi:Quinone oxidoreductase [Candidatus Burkholderia verschuerenii]|uniref:Quinone oxidoreductase n=1 Tax=Candidatus Burkholderia verschuerenii TaxID=242163 RepID=A0A0L0M9P9_9BURK|nr:quinone oxidoreductase [Candidatus Burkholderia verschuerenii]KND59020.1 Quinone oxidoreductase [Candidatus Burkholderia verschuerenii]